jgi:ATP-dependent DNA helicase RecG
VLGSGVRNLYKFTKIYSGGEPELIEGDVFRTTVPLNLSLTGMSDKVSDKRKMSDKRQRDALMAYLRSNGEITATEAAKIITRSPATARRLLAQLADEGLVAATGGNRNRKYKAIK